MPTIATGSLGDEFGFDCGSLQLVVAMEAFEDSTLGSIP